VSSAPLESPGPGAAAVGPAAQREAVDGVAILRQLAALPLDAAASIEELEALFRRRQTLVDALADAAPPDPNDPEVQQLAATLRDQMARGAAELGARLAAVELERRRTAEARRRLRARVAEQDAVGGNVDRRA